MREIPGILIALIYVLSLAIDGYILRDILTYVRHHRKIWIAVYVVTWVLCVALITSAVSWPARAGARSLQPLMWMLYTYFSIYIPKLIYVAFSAVGRLFRSKRRGIRINYGALVGAPIALLVCFLMWWGVLFTRNEIVVEKIDIVSDKLPRSFDGYRIAQFSDAHVGTWGRDTAFVSRLIDKINALDADMVVFTGDVVNRETSEMEPFLKSLSRLKASDGVFSILGNHDYGDYMEWDYPSEKESNRALMDMWQKQIGWELLNNRRVFIPDKAENDSIVLIGVENWGEPPFHQYGRLTEAYPLSKDSAYNLNDGRFKILLSHNPEHWNREVSKISNIDLTLSGHTHAMQMIFKIFGYEWSPSQWRYPQWKGLYEKEGSDGHPVRLYVNIGCGEVGVPTRLGSAYPEITEITLHSSK